MKGRVYVLWRQRYHFGDHLEGDTNSYFHMYTQPRSAGCLIVLVV